eukprot:Opistho-2@49066
MVIPFDDHMVHRGHAVFDTTTVANGKVFQLDLHLERLKASAQMAKIPLPFGTDRMREIVLRLAAIAKKRDSVMIRMYLSVGAGGFGISPAESTGSIFYAVAHDLFVDKKKLAASGVPEATVTADEVPLKPPMLARMKSTNYLLNALVCARAAEKGGSFGIQVDERGFVGESCVMNAAFVGKDGVFRHPKFDGILTGITVTSLIRLADRLVKEGILKAVSIEDIHIDSARESAEIILFGGASCLPVTSLDGHVIGSGTPGPVARAFQALLTEQEAHGEGEVIDVPYDD